MLKRLPQIGVEESVGTQTLVGYLEMAGLARESDRDLEIIGYDEKEMFKRFDRELGPLGWDSYPHSF
jgi:hypothetical protein